MAFSLPDRKLGGGVTRYTLFKEIYLGLFWVYYYYYYYYWQHLVLLKNAILCFDGRREKERKVCVCVCGGGGGMILSSLFTILVDEPLELPFQTISSMSK